MVVLEGVSKSFGGAHDVLSVVDDVSLRVDRGELAVLSGPSGSGKTTLLNLIAGMTRPDRGRIEVAGQQLTTLGARELAALRASSIGFVFQFQNLVSTLNVLENVLLPSTFSRRKTEPARASALLERLGLGNRLRARPRALSQGEQRRVGIARAVAQAPAVLLADEPTSDLDIASCARVVELFAELSGHGAAVIVATHDDCFNQSASRRLAILGGRVTTACLLARTSPFNQPVPL